jgi:hypothetical protein
MYKSRIKACLGSISNCLAVLGILIRQISMFLGLLDPDPDPLVRGMNLDSAPDPDPSMAKQKLLEIPSFLMFCDFFLT